MPKCSEFVVYCSHVTSKSRLGMQCYDFNRTVKTETMITDREEKKVCMGEAGSPEIITMMEVFQIGQDMDLGEGPADGDDTNLAPLPSFKGHVTALGSLISMTRITNSKASRDNNIMFLNWIEFVWPDDCWSYGNSVPDSSDTDICVLLTHCGC